MNDDTAADAHTGNAAWAAGDAAHAGGRNVVALLRQLREGSATFGALTTRERSACVAHLWSEALSTPESAAVLGCDERTVRRYRRSIARANAVHVDPAFDGQVAGRLLAEAEATMGRLGRIARDPNASHRDRIEADRQRFSIMTRAVQFVQSLGFLSTVAPARQEVPHGGPLVTLRTIDVLAKRRRGSPAPPVT